MKKLFFQLIIINALFFIVSCNEKVESSADVIGKWEAVSETIKHNGQVVEEYEYDDEEMLWEILEDGTLMWFDIGEYLTMCNWKKDGDRLRISTNDSFDEEIYIVKKITNRELVLSYKYADAEYDYDMVEVTIRFCKFDHEIDYSGYELVNLEGLGGGGNVNDNGNGGNTDVYGDNDGNVLVTASYNTGQLYHMGNMSANTTYFRLSLFNYPSNVMDGLVIEGFCDEAYQFKDFKLAPGVYKFSSVYGRAKTFIEGEYFDYADKVHKMGTYYYGPQYDILMEGGNFTVSLSGDTYTITTNFEGYNGKGSYKNLCYVFNGKLQKIDYFNC